MLNRFSSFFWALFSFLFSFVFLWVIISNEPLENKSHPQLPLDQRKAKIFYNDKDERINEKEEFVNVSNLFINLLSFGQAESDICIHILHLISSRLKKYTFTSFPKYQDRLKAYGSWKGILLDIYLNLYSICIMTLLL